jgi:crotonobetainyl-CoA:carnitine CoA-transferase CaiB-like acyl-CoA transferase
MRDLGAALRAADVLHAPVNDYRRYFDDAHVAASGAIAWVDHPEPGRIPLHRIPGLPQPDRRRPRRAARPSASTRARCSPSWASLRRMSPALEVAAPSAYPLG